MTPARYEYDRNRRLRFIALRPGEGRGEDMDGLCGLVVRSQQQVAQIMGVSRQAVQQIERMALFKLRRAFHREIQEHAQQSAPNNIHVNSH